MTLRGHARPCGRDHRVGRRSRVAARKLLADVPLGRIGEAMEIADAILFMAGDRSRYMTGAELVLDGGTTAQ